MNLNFLNALQKSDAGFDVEDCFCYLSSITKGIWAIVSAVLWAYRQLSDALQHGLKLEGLLHSRNWSWLS